LISTIPAFLVGGLLTDFFKSDEVRQAGVVVLTLGVVGVLMIVVDHYRAASEKDLKALSGNGALRIGLAQALALFPGVSRSGITIIAGRLERLKLADAAEYSFLLAIPVLSGALFRSLLEPATIEFIRLNNGAVLLGSLVAFISGMGAIHFMLTFLKKHGLKPFGIYRIALATLVLITVLFK
jgi:undecaprenyl-diphosphatase